MRDVVSVKLMRDSDMATINGGISGIELMHRAAMGVYNSVTWHKKIAIVCGDSNNAGDGYALALILKDNGYNPHIITLGSKLSPDGEYYLNLCKNREISTLPLGKCDLSAYEIIVDCIFGTGFRSVPTGIYADAINKINSSGAYVVSVDINSGLNGDSGLTTLAVKSDLTVSIGTVKGGLVLGMARDYAKRVVNCNIGIEIIDTPYHLIEENDVKSVLKERKSFSNKGDFGYVALIGGCMEYSGAIKLANLALSSLKTGAGVAKLATARSIYPSVSPYLVESTFYPLSDRGGNIIFKRKEIDSLLRGVRAVAIGMGIGNSKNVHKILVHILKNYDITVIIDADGLNSLAKYGMNILKETKCNVILTPHPKEMERLSGVKVTDILSDPINIAKRFASEYNITLLLKGSATVVTDGKDVYISDRGCSGMATAGSGDVLSGVILGVCAQNNIKEETPLNVVSAAFINGMAGEIAQMKSNEISMTALDTVNSIAEAISKIKG